MKKSHALSKFILFLLGQFSVPMAIITLVWGILAGVGGNINQFL